MLDLQAELLDLAAIEAESLGWVQLDDRAYLHVGDPEGDVITVVGVADAGMAGMNVVWVGW
jgi:DNA-directed RNA polymerase subunit H (RpoH/RPB5)